MKARDLRSELANRSRPESRRARWSLLALAASLSLATGCSLVIGDAPRGKEDPERDAQSEHDGDVVEPPESEAGSPQEDAGTQSLDADMPDASAAIMEAGTSDSDAGPVDAGPVDGGAREDGGADDAAADAGPPPDCGSSSSVWYPDGDDDDYGRSAESVRACTKPSGNWKLLGGDCNDNDPRVHPEQPMYFDTPFPDKDGNPTYDYDCSGNEDGNPGQEPLMVSCEGLLSGIACSGMGYIPQQARSGPGVNNVCGSRKIGTCMSTALLTCSTRVDDAPTAYRCK